MRLKRFVAPIVVAGIVASLSPSTARAADPVELPAILPLTGQAGFLGQEEAQALRVIEADVNRSGGIGGRPLRFLIEDDQSVPAVGVQLATQAMTRKTPAILGSSLVATCNAMAPLMKSGPVDYCFSPGVHPAAGSYVFSSSISTKDLLAASAVYFRERGWKKVAIITSTDATGQDAERNIDAAFNASNGLTIVTREHFSTTDLSVAAQMAHIKSSGAQAAILWSTGTPFATLLRGAYEAGLDIPLETGDGNLTYAQMKAYGAFMPKNLIFAAPLFTAPNVVSDPAVKKSITAFLDAFKATSTRPDIGQSLAWDPAMLVVDALKKLGPTASAPQIRAYLAGLHRWNGANGAYDFDAVPQRGLGINGVVMVRWDAAKDAWVGISKPGGAVR
jgi:branched-chain amino acid transport system substrate-binding protein